MQKFFKVLFDNEIDELSFEGSDGLHTLESLNKAGYSIVTTFDLAQTQGVHITFAICNFNSSDIKLGKDGL